MGTNSASYQPVVADVGKLIKVKVSFTDGDNFSEARTSLPFGPIAELTRTSATPSTLVSNTGQSPSANADITQRYAVGFRLGGSRPRLRNLQRLDRAGRGPVQSDRPPCGAAALKRAFKPIPRPSFSTLPTRPPSLSA